MSGNTDDFKRGDRVVRTRFGTTIGGMVTKAGRGVTAQVRWDGSNRDEREYVENLRRETDEDVAKREHDEKMRKWREERPTTEIAKVMHATGWGSIDEIGAAVSRADNPDRMRQAARELEALADWFARRPTMCGDDL